MSLLIDLSRIAVIFLSYDEPEAEENFRRLQSLVPRAGRVHGVNGLDAVYNRAGDLGWTPQVVTVDGDNFVTDSAFFTRRLQINAPELDAVISFSARIAHNGLAYGNGGIKIWPRAALREIRAHDPLRTPGASSDFFERMPYVLASGVPSRTSVTGTALHAFRAGFREGARLARPPGSPAPSDCPDMGTAEALHRHVSADNLERLRIWCMVGADVENGAWAIHGARLGCAMAALDRMDMALVSDYDGIAKLWRDEAARYEARPGAFADAGAGLIDRLNEELGLALSELDEEGSRAARDAYVPPPRIGRIGPA